MNYLRKAALQFQYWKICVAVLAALVVGLTSYALIVPAITLDEDTAETQSGIDLVTEETVDASSDIDAEAAEDVPVTEPQPVAEENEDDNEKAAEATAATINETVVTEDDKTFEVTVSAGADAQLSPDAELEVAEITEEDEDYDTYVEETAKALEEESVEQGETRFFDISILQDGEKLQPAAPVDVEIRIVDRTNEGDVQIVHFNDEKKAECEVMEASTEGDTVRFETDGFSVYAIVEAPEPAETSYDTVTAVEEDTAYNLSVYRNNTTQYFTSNLNGNSAFAVTTNQNSAASWYFEEVPDGTGNYYIYILNGEQKQYIQNPSGNLAGLTTDQAEAAAFVLSPASSDTFYFKLAGEDKWLQYSGSGSGIRFWGDTNNAGNSRIRITTLPTVPDDPYGLDGKTYGIAYHNEDVSAAALTSEARGSNRLKGERILVRPDILNDSGILLMSQEGDIAEWTFESVLEDKYYLKTTVDGAEKYLTIDGANVTLQDAPDPNGNSLIRAIPGTGANEGKYRFTAAGGYSLNLDGGQADNGFNGNRNNVATSWLNLVEKSKTLDNSDFTSYTAHKVSVSDTEKVTDKTKVVIYTRVWNDDEKKYDFYVVSYDGTLVKCYESGDTINWVGSSINRELWEFTEYTGSDGKPNYYYELMNTYSDTGAYPDKYVAPQAQDGQILSENTIGINLNGRRYGNDYTKITAWDDYVYGYTGWKVENGRVVTCPMDDADDFYFAIINENEGGEEPLTVVDTVDNDDYGITMKMIDFNKPIVNNRDSVQSAFFGGDNNVAGLLSTNLDENGYPSTTDKTGTVQSLANLFVPDNMQTVDNLLLESTYRESGYFEYDSTQNFAHLNEDGTFTVYDQLATIGDDKKKTRTHGQFMPYNDITEESEFSQVKNTTDVLGNPLPDTDPRKDENLYRIPVADADYFFGMEMEASFTQTESGLDAWGHDIIFEFSGDDDFWLYVDGELVLDLGGVHAASVGKINFRTGEVQLRVNDENGNVISSRTTTTPTTLRAIYESNYRERNPDATDDEVAIYLNDIFEDGGTVFKDFSKHTMKVFYMERGAGASNLHMRFNLASVKPGTVVLSKEVTGTDGANLELMDFAYQIFYKTQDDGDQSPYRQLTNADGVKVTYKGKTGDVPYVEEYDPLNGDQTYSGVYLLKPGEAAEIQMPEKTVSYYIVECGVNTNVIEKVYANGTELTGTGAGVRKDFETSEDSMENRPEVKYNNQVDKDAMRTLTITKRVFKEDGTTPLHSNEDNTPFSFRLYVGGENAANPSLADMFKYHVLDPQGNFCKWDSEQQTFVSLGKTNFDDLTADEVRAATFRTSMYGSISKIPADYSVVVRNLVIDSKFKVEERDYEVPEGYSFNRYERTDGYGNTTQGETENAGTIRAEKDPKVDVVNLRGWGLTVKKVWSDDSFMDSHDDIYFGVYIGDVLLEGTLRQMKTSVTEDHQTAETSLYWYFQHLETGTIFEQYTVREVAVTNPVVNEDGYVTNYGSAEPIDEGGTLDENATPQGASEPQPYHYTVSYEQGSIAGANNNVREDTVTNSRPGIKIVKEEVSSERPLAGARFTIKDSQGNIVGRNSFTSDENGLVAIAYLADGTYTLTETKSPAGYQGLSGPLTIRTDGHIVEELTGSDSDSELFAFDNTPDSGDMPTITVRNLPLDFKAVKVGKEFDDSEETEPLEGVHFALYAQVKDSATGELRPDINPVHGYEDLVTDSHGEIPQINSELQSGKSYYLHEEQTLTEEGYKLFDDSLLFSISDTGIISIEENEHWTLTGNTITIVNVKSSGVRLPDSGGPGTTWIYLLGSILFFASGIALVARRRLRRGYK